MIFILVTIGTLVLFYLSTHYPMRSCLSSLSYNCGALCINMASNAAYANWTFGAALSFKSFNTHYTCHGGHSNQGNFCGIFFTDSGYLFSDPRWSLGAAL